MVPRWSDWLVEIGASLSSLQPGPTVVWYQPLEERWPFVLTLVSVFVTCNADCFTIGSFYLTVVCQSLITPTNGMISYSDPTLGVGSVATYNCENFYTLNGESTRTCQSNGAWSWSGLEPTCEGTYKQRNIVLALLCVVFMHIAC